MSARKTLLVVEDETVAREGLAVILRQEGYEVILAANGEEALHRLRIRPEPDLIVLDMLMPVLDGWHFLRRLQREEGQPTIPIIVTTGTSLTPEWAKDHGCQGFVRKPIELENLLAEISRCLG
jgi:two-component system, chemotaxis family, chemotaxis protein CheY